MKANQPQAGQSGTDSVSSELRMIPAWSVLGGIAVFMLMQYVMWVVVPEHRHHSPPPFGFRLYFNMSISALAALYVLMVGYISRDSPRRGMSTTVWMVVCLVIPSGIGAVLYFLLRQPVLSLCPACGARIESAYHFCPQCAYQVAPCCGNCHRTTRLTDLFCVHCGHDLAADRPPKRLHAFAE